MHTHNYSLPENIRIYAVGDIHGHAQALDSMHDLITQDREAYPVDKAVVIYLGDYIDRGPDSKGVVDRLIARELEAPAFEHVFLMGNHEDAMMEFIKNPQGHRQDWLQWGGAEAAESYGVSVDQTKPYGAQAERIAAALNAALPLLHREFFRNLTLYHAIGDYVFVHAGVRPGIALERQSKQDLTFTREPFMSHDGDFGFYVVHGHTPPKNRQIDIRHNRINLDTGLYMGGALSCGVFEENRIRFFQV